MPFRAGREHRGVHSAPGPRSGSTGAEGGATHAGQPAAWQFFDQRAATARVLIVAAHPDDETIGAGILLTRLPAAHVLHVTAGASRTARGIPASFGGSLAEYAAVRRRELARAMELAAVTEQRRSCLGVADLEAIQELPRLARQIAARIAVQGPAIVVTHAYEGGHPDHDATALGVHAAVALLRRRGAPSPRLIEMALYHAQPGARSPFDRVVQEFLPDHSASPAAPVVLDPTPRERERKRLMLACFATQHAVLRWLSPGPCERFRQAPAYDFTRPPHAGAMLYELGRLPMTASRWRNLAAKALRDLAS